MVLVVKNSLPMQKIHEMWIQSLGQEAPLEEEMATYSSILAWDIPWTEEPSRLQSKGPHKVDMTEHSGRDRSMNLPVLIFPY